MPLPSRLTVVSKPAASTSPAVDFSSSSVSPTPPSWAATSWLSRSSPGFLRRLDEVLGQPLVELAQRRLDLAELPPGDAEVEARRGRSAEPEHLLAVLLRDAKDLRDHGDGQEAAVRRHDVGRTARVDLREQIVSDLLRALPQLLDRPDTEDPRDELAVAGVVRRLGHQQRRRSEWASGASFIAQACSLATRFSGSVGMTAECNIGVGQQGADSSVVDAHKRVLAPVERAGAYVARQGSARAPPDHSTAWRRTSAHVDPPAWPHVESRVRGKAWPRDHRTAARVMGTGLSWVTKASWAYGCGPSCRAGRHGKQVPPGIRRRGDRRGQGRRPFPPGATVSAHVGEVQV